LAAKSAKIQVEAAAQPQKKEVVDNKAKK